MAVNIPALFAPIEIGALTLPHRLWVAPMCQYSSVDGMPSDWHVAHLGSFAIGRAGLVMTEAAAVLPEGRISPSDVGIWNDAQLEAWKRVVGFIHTQGVAAGVQLAHAGRKASEMAPLQGRGYADADHGGWIARGPSSVAYGSLPAPKPLSIAEIHATVGAFADAARRSVLAGFDLIEIHAAHGYLINNFLSPISNTRDDEYGGDEDRRCRFLLEIVDAVKSVVPEGMPIVVRLSATDWVEDGLGLEETVRIVQRLERHGVALVSISSGGNDDRQEIPVGPGYQLPLARRVRESAGIPVGVAGLITSPQQAESVLVDGGADVVYIARQLLREPTFALRAAAELGGPLEWPWQYRMARFAGSIP